MEGGPGSPRFILRREWNAATKQMWHVITTDHRIHKLGRPQSSSAAVAPGNLTFDSGTCQAGSSGAAGVSHLMAKACFIASTVRCRPSTPLPASGRE